MIPRLKEQYEKTLAKSLTEKFKMKNKLMAPMPIKIVLNMGLGNDGSDQKQLKACINDMSLISGQRPVQTKFKKSISNFKSRKGYIGGLKTTLRKNRMYEFIDRLVNIALPRIKDFRGLSLNGFDEFGNYTFGIKEHIIFPEINFDKVDKIRGMNITIVTTGNNKEHTLALLKEFNFPFKKEKDKKKVKKTKQAQITEKDNKEDTNG